MKTFFVSKSNKLLPNWSSAFPTASILICNTQSIHPPENSLIFIDFSRMSDAEKTILLSTLNAKDNKIIVLSPIPNDDEAVFSIKLGAKGYGHSLSSDILLKEISTVVAHGGIWVGNSILKRILNGLPSAPVSSPGKTIYSLMSAREIMVAKQVALGETNIEISNRLDITERTVKAHISSLFDKLKVRNRVELALAMSKFETL